MTLSAVQTKKRLWIIVALTLLPWPAVWLGMYRLDNLFLTFVLYHGVCLLPAVFWGRSLWRRAIRWPTPRQWAAVLGATVVTVPLTILATIKLGQWFIDSHSLLSVVTERGFHTTMLLSLGLYFVPVNAVLEELFWRGVVLNELRGMSETAWTLGAIWTAFTFAAWHYLVIRLLLRPGWAEAAILLIIVAGIFLAWLYRQTKSIVVPILWHGLVFDLPLIVIFAAILHTVR